MHIDFHDMHRDHVHVIIDRAWLYGLCYQQTHMFMDRRTHWSKWVPSYDLFVIQQTKKLQICFCTTTHNVRELFPYHYGYEHCQIMMLTCLLTFFDVEWLPYHYF